MERPGKKTNRLPKYGNVDKWQDRMDRMEQLSLMKNRKAAMTAVGKSRPVEEVAGTVRSGEADSGTESVSSTGATVASFQSVPTVTVSSRYTSIISDSEGGGKRRGEGTDDRGGRPPWHLEVPLDRESWTDSALTEYINRDASDSSLGFDGSEECEDDLDPQGHTLFDQKTRNAYKRRLDETLAGRFQEAVEASVEGRVKDRKSWRSTMAAVSGIETYAANRVVTNPSDEKLKL